MLNYIMQCLFLFLDAKPPAPSNPKAAGSGIRVLSARKLITTFPENQSDRQPSISPTSNVVATMPTAPPPPKLTVGPKQLGSWTVIEVTLAPAPPFRIGHHFAEQAASL
jgi:hypothetical protein